MTNLAHFFASLTNLAHFFVSLTNLVHFSASLEKKVPTFLHLWPIWPTFLHLWRKKCLVEKKCLGTRFPGSRILCRPVDRHKWLYTIILGVTSGQRVAVQGVFSPHWVPCSFQGKSCLRGRNDKKCLAHGRMEWTSVDSCMATSRQGPHTNHVEGITKLSL